jgi:cytosine/adenosine deaminase-related metal-dependent hydrolase
LDWVSPANHRVVDLGDGAIIPGLVNAHTHLEFSDLEQPLGQPGIKFTDWIRLIVAQRNESNQESDSNGGSGRKSAAIKRGIDESFESGVWLIGEVATMPFELNDYRNRRPNMTLMCFLEQLGRDDSTFPDKEHDLAAFLSQRTDADPATIQFGASPHAPYSVAPGLLRQICRQSTTAGRPVALHLAETLDERELLEHQTGEFVSLLQDFGVWNPDSFAKLLSVRESLEVIAGAPSSLVVHGNYLSASELDFVAANSERMSIVFCPRTHQYFGHTPYPLEKMLKREINVCLGTDSRASNPNLDLFEEAKQVANSLLTVDPTLILEMATLNGANALGVADAYGSLTAGKKPALCFVTHPDSSLGRSPYDWLFADESKCSPLFDQ